MQTYEQVSKYHPDKYADAISQAIVDFFTEIDPNAHCGVEVMVKNNKIILGGEISYNAPTINKERFNDRVKTIAQSVGLSLGYRTSLHDIHNYISEQSAEINKAVVTNDGAGDQGIVVGYATNRDDFNNLDPGMFYANSLVELIEILKGQDNLSPFAGDAKVQVTMNGEMIDTILISTCVHSYLIDLDAINNYIHDKVYLVFKDLVHPTATVDTKIIFNPSGLWTIGGPTADCGITGRKLVCDFYGPNVPIGGGNIWGKDNTKVDRSGAIAARIIALDIVDKFKDIDSVKIEIAYAIGRSQPVSIGVRSGNDSRDDFLKSYIKNTYDLTPSGLQKLIASKKGRILNFRW